MSVVVSDEAGQLYIFSTGQGESQKDAKYDQVFKDLILIGKIVL